MSVQIFITHSEGYEILDDNVVRLHVEKRLFHTRNIVCYVVRYEW